MHSSGRSRLNPRLSVAHKFYANLEAETGRAREAIVRLLNEATRHGNDPELFAGLVHACRYAGLFEESIAAHAEARRLDPNINTSFQQTLMMKRDIDQLARRRAPERVAGGDEGIRVIGLGLSGRRDEARAGAGRDGPAIADADVSDVDVASRRLARSAHRRHDVHASRRWRR